MTEKEPLSRRAFVEQILDMIEYLEIPEKSSDLNPKWSSSSRSEPARVKSAPFRDLLAELSPDNQKLISLDWITFANALNARKPTRQALRVALLPICAQFVLLNLLPLETFSDGLSEAFRVRRGQLQKHESAAKSTLEHSDALAELAPDDFSCALVEDTAEFEPDDFALKATVEIAPAPPIGATISTDREPTTGVSSPNDTHRVADDLHSLAGDLAALAMLDALDLLRESPDLQARVRVILEHGRMHPSSVLDDEIRDMADKLRRFRQVAGKAGTPAFAPPYIADELHRVADDLQSRPPALPLPAPPTATASTLRAADPWRRRFIALACVAILACTGSSWALIETRERAADQAERAENFQRAQLVPTTLSASLSPESPVHLVFERPDSSRYDWKFAFQAIIKGSQPDVPRISDERASQGILIPTNENPIQIQINR